MPTVYDGVNASPEGYGTFPGVIGGVDSINLDSLFANGEEGVRSDPSNLSTLFQDATGTVPVSTDADVVGFDVDVSQGLTLGAEEDAEAADFSGYWILPSGASISGGNLVFSDVNGGTGAIRYAAWLDDAETCKVVVTVEEVTSGGVRIRLGASSADNSISPVMSSAGTYTFYLRRADTVDYYYITARGTTSAVVNSVSIKKLHGNHASQTTLSYKPKWYSPNILRFDGIDDRLEMTLKPTTTGSIAMRFKGGTASRVALGAQPASDGRCYIGLASDGSIAGGIGAHSTSTIKGSTDKRGVEVTAILTWDGSTVTLYEDGVEVYSAAQSGAVDTANAFNFGSLNNNGSSAAHWNGDVFEKVVTDDVITAEEAVNIHNKWSA